MLLFIIDFHQNTEYDLPAVWVSVLFRLVSPDNFSSSSFSLYPSLFTESMLPLHSPSSFICFNKQTKNTHLNVHCTRLVAGKMQLLKFSAGRSKCEGKNLFLSQSVTIKEIYMQTIKT